MLKKSELMPFAALIFATLVPLRAAIAERVSPFFTVYLPLPFEEADFAFDDVPLLLLVLVLAVFLPELDRELL